SYRLDPVTREVVEAAREYRDESGQRWAAHYTDTDITYYWQSGAGWRTDRTVPHAADMVPVIPFVNRARIDDRCGRSEIADVIGITDAASRTLTNMQIAQELVAIPQRDVVGASAGDFQDEAGRCKRAWEAYIGNLMLVESENAKPGQFPGANLQTFTEVVNLYGRLVCSVSGLPPNFLGFISENPASADAIRAGEARLVKRAE